jgi:hypothetical protein
MAFVIDSYTDTGDDVLRVDAHDDTTGRKVTVFGWASALTNHYPASAYAPDGSLLPGATPRAMTNAERNQYLRGLVTGRTVGEKKARDRRDRTDKDPEAGDG